MNPGDVARHNGETTHHLGGGHYIVVRHTPDGANVGEITPWHGSHNLHTGLVRADAEVIARAYAATRTSQER